MANSCTKQFIQQDISHSNCVAAAHIRMNSMNAFKYQQTECTVGVATINEL